LEEFFEFGVADERKESGFYTIGGRIVGRVVVTINSVERSRRFIDNW